MAFSSGQRLLNSYMYSNTTCAYILRYWYFNISAVARGIGVVRRLIAAAQTEITPQTWDDGQDALLGHSWCPEDEPSVAFPLALPSFYFVE